MTRTASALLFDATTALAALHPMAKDPEPSRPSYGVAAFWQNGTLTAFHEDSNGFAGEPLHPPKDASAHARLAWDSTHQRAAGALESLWTVLAEAPATAGLLADTRQGYGGLRLRFPIAQDVEDPPIVFSIGLWERQPLLGSHGTLERFPSTLGQAVDAALGTQGPAATHLVLEARRHWSVGPVRAPLATLRALLPLLTSVDEVGFWQSAG